MQGIFTGKFLGAPRADILERINASPIRTIVGYHTVDRHYKEMCDAAGCVVKITKLVRCKRLSLNLLMLIHLR